MWYHGHMTNEPEIKSVPFVLGVIIGAVMILSLISGLYAYGLDQAFDKVLATVTATALFYAFLKQHRKD